MAKNLCCLLKPYECIPCASTWTLNGHKVNYSLCSAHRIEVKGDLCEAHYNEYVQKRLARFK